MESLRSVFFINKKKIEYLTSIFDIITWTSFLRRQESRIIFYWMPASAGMTNLKACKQ